MRCKPFQKCDDDLGSLNACAIERRCLRRGKRLKIEVLGRAGPEAGESARRGGSLPGSGSIDSKGTRPLAAFSVGGEGRNLQFCATSTPPTTPPTLPPTPPFSTFPFNLFELRGLAHSGLIWWLLGKQFSSVVKYFHSECF